MSDREIINKSTEIFKEKDLQYLFESGFIDIFRCKIALVKRHYSAYLKKGVATMQAITNCSIDFGISEGTVTRYIYQYKETKF